MKLTDNVQAKQIRDRVNSGLIGLLFRGLLLLCGVSSALSPTKLIAQSYLTNGGAPTFVAPEPVELGFADTANGQLHLDFPLGSFPQRGSQEPLTIRLIYNSTIWKIQGAAGSYSWQHGSSGDPGFDGWRLSPSSSRAWANVVTDSGCQAHGSWTDEAGTERWFPLTALSCTSSTSGYAADSSAYKMYYDGASIKVYAPDGSLVCQAIGTSVCNQQEDNNGNQKNFTANPAYTDTLGRSLPLAGLPPGGQINLPNSQGGTSLYTITSMTIPVKTKFLQSGVTEYIGNLTVIQKIVLPDNTTYVFTYDCDSSTGNIACSSPAGQTAYYGLLTRVTLPSTGQITYGWTTFSDSYGNRARWLSSRQSQGGFWTYSPQVISTCTSTQVGCQQKMMVIINNARTDYTFTLNNGAWPTQIQSYEYSSGTLLSTVTNTYDFSVACPFFGCHGASYVRLLKSQTTVPVPSGTSITKQTTYTYDSPQTANKTAIKEWRYYSGTSPTFPSLPDRATYFTYLTTGTNNINRPLKVTLCNNSGSDADCLGGGAKVSQTLYTYDSYLSCASGLTSVPGVTHHDDSNFGVSNTQRGNPTQIQRWVSGSASLSTQLCYDTTGQVLQETDSTGNTTSYTYADNLFNETGPSSMSAYTPPTPTNAYLKTVTAGGLTASFGYYFGSGKQAVSTDPNSLSSYFYYSDLFDRPTQATFPIGWRLTNYTSATQMDSYVPVADTSASAGCTSCRHNQINLDSWGRKTNEKLVNAPGGAVNVDTTYDFAGRVLSVSHAYVNASDPSHVFETLAYDSLNRKLSVTHPDNQSSRVFYGTAVTGPGGGAGLSTQQSSTTTYGLGYPMLTVDETGTKKKQQWFDGFGRVIEVDEPVTAATAGTSTVSVSGFERSTYYYPCGVSTCPVLTYDTGYVRITVNGFTSQVTYGQSDTSTTIAGGLANGFGSPSSPVTASVSGTSILLTSKATGSSTNYTLTTASGTYSPYFTGSSFSAYGLSLSGGYDSGSSFATPIVTSYVYDALDNLTQVVQGVQTRTFTYDGLGRRTSMTTPEAGTDSFYFTKSDNVSLCAGSSKAICRKTDARGITTTYTYDSLSRLTGKTYSNGQGAVTYQYDQGGAAAFALGRRTGTVDPSGSESYTHDQGGRITQIQKVIGTTSYPINYQYNVAGQITRITYPSGRILQQNLDSIGLLNTIVSGTTTYASIPEPPTGYNAAGQILAFNYGNGVAANFSYSAARQQMTSLSYLKSAQTLLSLNYYYQKDSNCNGGTPGTTTNDGLIECIVDNVDSGRTAVYTYDALSRLSTAITNGSTGFTQWGLSETFDRYGNRLNQTLTAGSGPTNSLSFGTTPGAGAYTNRPDGYSFDASGNMLNDGANNLTYDAENCLTSTAATNYTCDAHGIRVKKAGATTTAYLFSGGKDIAEYDNGAAVSSPSREYVYLGSQLIATIQGTTTIYHHADHLSIRLTTDASGNKIGEQGHYPYGETWYASNTTTKFIFTTYERDGESGNDYAMARFYINRFGRFSCADPLLGRPGDPQTWNRYAYVRNNPINNVDPSGMGFWGFLANFFKALLSVFTGGKMPWNLPFPGTPPTFPGGPLDSTNIMLNSIYHPRALSPYLIIQNFAASPIYGPQQNPCEKFSQSLVDRLYNANKEVGFKDQSGAIALGVKMIDQAVANVDEHGVPYAKYKYPIGGFKPKLVDNSQDADVYHHILGFAGAEIAKMPEATIAAWARDWEQVYVENRQESETELRDDAAGMAVGRAMGKTTGEGKSGNYKDLAKQIMDILCL